MKRLYPMSRGRRSGQRGVVMIVTLVVLVVLLVGAVALLRSSDSTSTLAGQVGFRRDMKNQAERAISMAINAMQEGGALDSPAERQASNVKANYSAAQLETDPATGVPTLLLGSDKTFKDAGYTVAISDAAAAGANAESGITVRYLIDRLCPSAGAIDESSCSRTSLMRQYNGQDSNAHMASSSFRATQHTLYRISVRVDGPRGTQAFFQSAVAL
jgi:type IV pilus assembly protein PilX